MTRLLPCPSCRRHVRSTETSCPFCAVALAFAEPPPLPSPVGRLTRAAVFAGAALASACGSSQKPADSKLENTPTADAGAEMAPQPDAEVPVVKPDDYEHVQPMPYGAPPARDRLV
jgi:hypothetical protein